MIEGFQTALRQVAVAPIRVYRIAISPALPAACRFAPSCSAYAIEAVLQHGLMRGGWLGVRRLSRCHPWGEPGVDPVPTSTR